MIRPTPERHSCDWCGRLQHCRPRFRLATGVVVWALSVSALGAQSQEELQRLTAHVPLIEREGIPGSGIIAGLNGDVIYVVTARHVVQPEGGTCGSGVRVRLRLGSSLEDHELGPGHVRCHDDLDLALVEISTRDSARVRSFVRGLVEAETSSAAAGYGRIVIGNPGGSLSTNVTGRLLQTDRKGPAGDEIYYAVSPGSLGSGFSGGAVFTNDLQLLGMHIASEGRGVALRWERIREELKRWGVLPDLVVPPAGKPYLSFGSSSLDASEDAARGVIRRYVEAVRARPPREDAVHAVWPGVNRSDLRAWFGDAREIDLSLTDCRSLQLMPVDAADLGRYLTRGTIECGYTMRVVRRTGPEQNLPPKPTILTFDVALAEASGSWVIVSVR
jgi:hypothetical protein